MCVNEKKVFDKPPKKYASLLTPEYESGFKKALELFSRYKAMWIIIYRS